MDPSTPRGSPLSPDSPEISPVQRREGQRYYAKRTRPLDSSPDEQARRGSQQLDFAPNVPRRPHEDRLRTRSSRTPTKVRKSLREKRRPQKLIDTSYDRRGSFSSKYGPYPSTSRSRSESPGQNLQSMRGDRRYQSGSRDTSQSDATEEDEVEEFEAKISPQRMKRSGLRSTGSVPFEPELTDPEDSSGGFRNGPRRNPDRPGRPHNFDNMRLPVIDADSSRSGSEAIPPKKKKMKCSNSGSKATPSAFTNSFEPTIYFPEEGSISFDTVGGYGSVKEELRRSVIAPFRRLINQTEIKKEGSEPAKTAQVSKGALFWGPPGTGKTLMAKALAYECGRGLSRAIPVYIISGAELLTKWVGESESHLRAVFQHASENSPSIIFMDELDGLVRRRTTSENDSVNFNMVSTLLTLLNGVTDRGTVLALATTNFKDVLDPALLRSGRFDTKIHFPAPDKNERKLILEALTQKWLKKLDSNDAFTLAKNTTGFTGADLDLLCRKAQNLALQRHGKPDDFDLDKLEVGLTDFFSAWDGMEPSGHAVTPSPHQPLLPILQPLLSETLDSICGQIAARFPVRLGRTGDADQVRNTAAWAAFTYPSLMLDYDPVVFIHSENDPLILEVIVGALLSRIAEKYTVKTYDFKNMALENRIEHDLLSLMSDRSSVVALCNLNCVCTKGEDGLQIPGHIKDVLKTRDKFRSTITIITSTKPAHKFSAQAREIFPSGVLEVPVKNPRTVCVYGFFKEMFVKETARTIRDDGVSVFLTHDQQEYVGLLEKLSGSLRRRSLDRLMSVYSDLSASLRQDLTDQHKKGFRKLVKKIIDEDRQSIQA